ncbi:hypothetical protein [Rhodoblastus sp.]|uniref:hypothetical protein n=1 Tax=Rhodoblastus sp. TaxID=1962975 RepID=UPI003F9825FD
MIFLLQNLAPWVLAAGALGLVFGLLGGRSPRPFAFVLVLAVVLESGAGAEALGLAPGRYGLWLEAGLAIFGAYALGWTIARVLASLFAPRARKQPDWLDAARETLAQAEAFVAAAPGALAANESAARRMAAEAPPPAPPPAPAEDQPAHETADALAAIVGLDGRSARELRAHGVSDLKSLANLTPERRRSAAGRLGLDEATIDFWSAQARLYAHGVARPPSGAPADAPPDAAPAPAVRDDSPQADASRAMDAFYPGARPPGAPVAPAGGGDDLTRIAGIDAAAERRLQGLGVWTFAQIAAWTADQARWVEFYLAQPGRAGRENWRGQAIELAGDAPAAS